MFSDDFCASQQRAQFSQQYNFKVLGLEQLSDSERKKEQQKTESTWKNLKFDPNKKLGIQKNNNKRDCFRVKILSPSIQEKRFATLAFDYFTTKQPDRYVLNPDKTVSLKIFGLYEAALLGEDKYFDLLQNSSKCLLKSKAEFGRSLLYTSARSGYDKCVFQLLKIGCDVNEIQENGSTPLHVAAYYGHEETVKILVAFGASNKIKNKYNLTPSDEAKTEKIKEILKTAEQDNIYLLFTSLKEMGLAFSLDRRSNDQIIRIYKKGEDQEILIKRFRNNPKYKRTFHGTKFANLKSIFDHGLRLPGTAIGDKVVQVIPGHIEKGVKLFGVENWSDAVFVSPSPFYAASPVYAGRIPCNGKTYCCLVEAMVFNDEEFYDTAKSTVKSHKQVDGEPNLVEYRIDLEHTNKFDHNEEKNKEENSEDGDEEEVKSEDEKYLKKEMHKSSLKASSTCSNVIKGFDFECNQKNESEYKKNNAEQEEKLLTVFSILFIEESVFGGQLKYEEVIKLVEKYDII